MPRKGRKGRRRGDDTDSDPEEVKVVEFAKSSKAQARKDRKAKRKAKKGGKRTASPSPEPAADATANMRDVVVEGLMVKVPGKTLLEDTNLTIADKRKYALMGINGAGKTTLMTQIASREIPVPTNLRLIHVEQEVKASTETSVFETVIQANTVREELRLRIRDLEAKMDELDDDLDDATAEAYTKAEEEWEQMGAEQDEVQVRRILQGLGFPHVAQDRPTADFSGGWRMRISLARGLYMKPDLLLLDEPTNHLDLNAVIWLTEELRKWEGTLLVISHNKDFLNNICTDVIHLRDRGLHYYTGNYDAFKRQREIEFTTHAKEWAKVESHVKDLRKKSTPRKDVQEYLAKCGVTKPERPYAVNITFLPDTEPGSDLLVRCTDASFRHSDDSPYIFQNLSLGIYTDTKIAIVGPNGVGKSTLLRLLSQKLEAEKYGSIVLENRLRCGFYSQHFDELLPEDKTPVEYLLESSSDLVEHQARGYLGSIGLEGKAHVRPIGSLSGGQKARVVLSYLQVLSPHLLFLDEPTNHLDIESVEALSEAIRDFPGAVVMVTHDVDLITDTDCVLMEVVDGKLVETDYESYKARVLGLADDTVDEVAGAKETPKSADAST